MKFKLEIDCDNTAFDEPIAEVIRILGVARKMLVHYDVGDVIQLWDVNGNLVGSMKFKQIRRTS